MSIEETPDEDDRIPVVKAMLLGRDGNEESRVIETDQETRHLFQTNSVIEPPFDPATLAFLYEVSGVLRTCIDSYATNIDSFGHSLEPVVDLEDDETLEKIREAMIQERLLGLSTPTTTTEKVSSILKRDAPPAPNIGEDGKPTGHDDREELEYEEPTDGDVEARIAIIEREMAKEKLRLERFFDFCSVDESFVSLRMRTRQDIEMLGNGYWEALRNKNGDLVQFTYIPGYTMRMLPQDKVATEVEMPVRATLITEASEPIRKKFRKYIQIVQNGAERQVTFFKELGDPRIFSSLTGHPYNTPEDLDRAEKGVLPASEIIHFKIHSARTPYGVPRWISELLSVLGARHADEINLAYFENKSIPPMVITVSGGRMAKDTVKKIEDYIKNDVRGKKNYHKIMIIEAEAAGIAGATAGAVKIDIKPLTDQQNGDALFMEYRKANVLSVGSVFRLPKLLRGDSDDQNRATAQSALEFAEQQVFRPFRNEFDFLINRKILTDFGVRFWEFKSKGPDFSDPNELLKAINEASKSGYLTPEELRTLASRGFNEEFEKKEEPWATERPMQLTLAALSAGKADIHGDEDEPPVPVLPPGMGGGKPGAPGQPKPPGAPMGPPGSPGAKKPPAKPGEEGEDEEKDARKALDLPDLALPTPHDMAVAAVRLSRFSKYADAVSFFESHDEENADDV